MSQINVDIIRSRTGTAATCDKGLVVSGVTTATSFAGPLTGNVTGNADTATLASGLTGTPAITVGNVTSANVTNSKQTTSEHVNVTGISTLGGDVSIADKIIHTGDTDTAIRFPSADTVTVETGGSERVRVDSSGSLLFNQAQSKILVNTSDASDSSLLNINGGGDASQNRGAGLALYGNENSGNEGKLWLLAGNSGSANGVIAMNTAGSERLRITSTGGVTFSNGELVEKCYINSTAWSTTGTVNLDNGMVQYNSANLAGTTNTLDIISGAGINTTMSTGDMMSVTCITAVNAATAYIDNITIDGLAATETWVGGSAPTDGGTAGVDTYAFNIIKTAANTYTVIANQVKTS